MDDVGIKKFCTVISDHTSNVALAKKMIITHHSHIIINLLTTDIYEPGMDI